MVSVQAHPLPQVTSHPVLLDPYQKSAEVAEVTILLLHHVSGRVECKFARNSDLTPQMKRHLDELRVGDPSDAAEMFALYARQWFYSSSMTDNLLRIPDHFRATQILTYQRIPAPMLKRSYIC